MYRQPDLKKLSLFVRCITRWLKHNEEGLYDKAFQWPDKKRVNTFRMPRRGAKITDPQLEIACWKLQQSVERNLQVLAAEVHLGEHSHSLCRCEYSYTRALYESLTQTPVYQSGRAPALIPILPATLNPTWALRQALIRRDKVSRLVLHAQ